MIVPRPFFRRIVHPLERAGEALRFYRDFIETVPDELTVYASILTTPDGFDVLAIVPCYCGDSFDVGLALLEPLRKFGPPIADTIGSMPYLALQQMLDPAFPYGIHSYWKSNFVETLSDDAIKTFVSYARKRSSPRTVCIFEHSHGKVHRVAPEATAMPLRKHRLAMHLLTVWDGGDPEPHIQWTRQFWSAMQAYSAGSVYVNVLSADDTGRLAEAYGPNYERLAETKSKYDPANVFRVNHNIRPTKAAAG